MDGTRLSPQTLNEAKEFGESQSTPDRILGQAAMDVGGGHQYYFLALLHDPEVRL
jgi:hypothetical protein